MRAVDILSILSDLPGFKIFRKDRMGKIGGGELIAVKEGLQVTRRCDLERDGIEF